MFVINERMAQFWFCKPQTYGDWGDPTGWSVSRRYIHLLYHVPQTALNMRQCEGRVRDEIVIEYIFDFFRKSQTHHNAQRLSELGSISLFLGRDLFPVWVHFAVGAALLGQLKGWPSSLALATFQSEFLRESSNPPTSSVHLVARPFQEGERDA